MPGRVAPGMPATFIIVAGAPEDLPGSLARAPEIYVHAVPHAVTLKRNPNLEC